MFDNVRYYEQNYRYHEQNVRDHEQNVRYHVNITNILNSEETTLLFAPIVCNRGHFPQIKKLKVTLWRQIKNQR